MRSPPLLPHRPRSRAGFSLVEVTLALGIVALAVVATLGLMPIGLKAFEEANRANIEAEIIAQLSRDLEASSLKKLQQEFASSKTFYFDIEGRELTSSGGAGPADWIYKAEVELQPTQVNGQTVEATGRTVSTVTTLLKTAVISLTFKREPNKTRKFPIHIADRGMR